MSSPIDTNALEHLAELARLELQPAEEARLLRDLTNILGHFEELKALDTESVPPMAGGTLQKNILRDDAERESTNRGAGIESFPDKKEGYLKVPAVFEQ